MTCAPFDIRKEYRGKKTGVKQDASESQASCTRSGTDADGEGGLGASRSTAGHRSPGPRAQSRRRRGDGWRRHGPHLIAPVGGRSAGCPRWAAVPSGVASVGATCRVSRQSCGVSPPRPALDEETFSPTWIVPREKTRATIRGTPKPLRTTGEVGAEGASQDRLGRPVVVGRVHRIGGGRRAVDARPSGGVVPDRAVARGGGRRTGGPPGRDRATAGRGPRPRPEIARTSAPKDTASRRKSPYRRGSGRPPRDPALAAPAFPAFARSTNPRPSVRSDAGETADRSAEGLRELLGRRAPPAPVEARSGGSPQSDARSTFSFSPGL